MHSFANKNIFLILQETKELVHEVDLRCLELDAETKEIFVSTCIPNKPEQQWKIERINEDRLKAWES